MSKTFRDSRLDDKHPEGPLPNDGPMERLCDWVADNTRTILLLCVAFFVYTVIVSAAHAKCITNDKWRGDDKAQHALAGLGIGYIATMQTKDPMTGFLWAAGIGAAKEAVDATGGGQCSLQDLLVTALAGGVGAGLGKISLRYIDSKPTVVYTAKLNLL